MFKTLRRIWRSRKPFTHLIYWRYYEKIFYRKEVFVDEKLMVIDERVYIIGEHKERIEVTDECGEWWDLIRKYHAKEVAKIHYDLRSKIRQWQNQNLK